MKQLLLTALLLLGLSTPAWATRYWVATTGSDANACSAIDGDADPGVYKASPFSAQSCLTVAGDRLTIKAGTYTGTTARITTFASGTAGNHTIIEGDPGDAEGCALSSTCSTILQPTGAGNNTFINGPSHWTLRKLRLNNVNITSYYPLRIETGTDILVEDVEGYNTEIAGNSSSCFQLAYGATFTTYRRIHAHDCGELGGPFDHGMYLQGDDTTVEDSWIHDNSSGGIQCYTAVSQSDGRADRCTIRRNKIYNNGTNALVLEGNDDQAYDNEIYGNGGDGVQIGYSGALRTLLYNNVIYNNTGSEGVWVGAFGSASNSVIKNNIITGNDGAEIVINANSTGVVYTHNACTAAEGTECATANKLTIAAVTTCTVSASDFHHNATSTCIGAGTSVSTRSPNGTTDIGPYEAFGFSSATINENFLDVTLGMNLNVPVTVNLTGWAVNNGRTVTAASRLSGADSIVRLTISGAACAAESWTVTATASSATDSRSQPVTAFSAQAVTNNCGTAPPAEPGTPLIIYEMDENTGTTLTNTGSSGATDNGTLTGAWGTGKAGSGITLTSGSSNQGAVPYGSGVNPTTQSLTVAFWVNVASGEVNSEKYYFGSTTGTNQRLYIATALGTWQLGIQASGQSASSNLSVVAGWNRLCLVANSGTDIATLTVNGTVGTGEAAKAYTSYTLNSDVRMGSPVGTSGNPGATYDKFKLWTSAESCADDWAAENPPAPPSAATLTDKAFRFYQAHYATATTTLVPMAAVSTNVSVPVGESFALVKQTDATVANPDPMALRIRYSRNGGAFTEVPGDCNSNDQICFIGSASDATVVQGTIDACLSGALAVTAGVWNHTAAATPVFDLPQNGCTVHGFVLKFGVSVVQTDTYDFKLYNQTGVALDAYDPAGGARVTVSGGIGAPTGLHFSGPVSNTVAALIWPPVSHATLGGYHVYQSTTSGLYSPIPSYTVTVSGAQTTRSPVTQLFVKLHNAGTYYFKVNAFDLDGNESALSSEVSVTRTGFTTRGVIP